MEELEMDPFWDDVINPPQTPSRYKEKVKLIEELYGKKTNN